MHPMLRYYKQTWWLWLLLLLVFGFLGYKVSFIFFILMPFLIAYSVYFGFVRITEQAEQGDRP